MKTKSIILSVFTTLLCITANAQETVVVTSPSDNLEVPYHIRGLRFGAFLAPNISWMKPTASTDDKQEYNVSSNGSKIGFTYGLMADYFFAPNYGFATGIQITSTGGKMDATRISTTRMPGTVIKADFDYSLQYLEIPIALKLRTDEINRFRFFGQLGVSLAVNLSRKADYTVNYNNSDTVSKTASGSKIKLTGDIASIAPVMLQMNIGGGVEYPINNKLKLYAGLFFNNGFAPDATHPDKFDNTKLGYEGTFRDASTRLNNFALRIGLFF